MDKLKKGQNTDGYLTVYVALTVGILLSLIVTMLCGLRIHTIRFEAECVMDMAIESVFAEYHREMQKQYGLLFVDSSYGNKEPSEQYTADHLMHYLNLNFDSNGEAPFYLDLTNIQADNCTLSDVAYATDDYGEVLRYQINNYIMNSKSMGFGIFADSDSIISNLLGYSGLASRRRSENARVKSIVDEINASREENEEPYSVSNPAESVEDISGSSILYYALGSNELRSVNVDTKQYISHRQHKNGAGLGPSKDADGLMDRTFFNEYILKNCGFYGNDLDKSHMNYEVEYILKGKDSDAKNLEDVAEDIFKTRYAINMQYLLSSTTKQLEAEELATAAASAVMHPELIAAIKYSILFAWGYAESAKDLRIIYDGHKVGLVKTDAGWNTPLAHMMDFKSHLNEYNIPGGNIGYREYLYAFLMLASIDNTTMRLMDVMEMDIRDTMGNTNFKMDGMIYGLEATVNMSSGYGYGCNIVRKYAYET